MASGDKKTGAVWLYNREYRYDLVRKYSISKADIAGEAGSRNDPCKLRRRKHTEKESAPIN